MKVKVNTKSNFRNLNGQWLKVIEIVGTRVTCSVEHLTIDFGLSEVVEMNTNI